MRVFTLEPGSWRSANPCKDALSRPLSNPLFSVKHVVALIVEGSDMPSFSYVIELDQEIREDEIALMRKRQLLDAAWNSLLTDEEGAAATSSSESSSMAGPPEGRIPEKK